jgi:hypothetical protein
MRCKLMRAAVPDRPRQPIHVVRIVDDILDFPEIDALAEHMRAWLLSRYGEQTPNLVIVQGNSKETMRLIGEPHAVTRVRAAMFNAAVSWVAFEIE